MANLQRLFNVFDLFANKAKPKTYVEDLGNGVKLEMVLIPAGSFMMGSPDGELKQSSNERPQHQVTIRQEYYLGRFLVTQGQWQQLMGSNPSHFKKGDRYPVDSVSWNMAQEFLEKLNSKTNKTYRLPSEAEWEYACRGGTETPFYFGETITTDLADFDGNYTYGEDPNGTYRRQTTEVETFSANGFGLYDMHGNLWEWCEDDWEDSYNTTRTQNPYKCTSTYKVLRGGSWISLPGGCRSAARGWDNPGNAANISGFRIALDLRL